MKKKIKGRDGELWLYEISECCSIPEYAKEVGMSYWTVRRMCMDHTLPAWQEGKFKHWRIAVGSYKALKKLTQS